MSLIRLKNVDKEFQSGDEIIKAVDDVSCEIEKGEFVAITGKSGSGKSTLLNIIGGIDRVTKGTVYYKGKDIKTYKKLSEYRRKNIGYVFQFFNLVPILTVEENICLPLLINKKKIPYGRVNELLRRLNLERKRNILSRQLSGGEQQRTAIGRAIISKPEILLADEPTGNLDRENTAYIMELFEEMHESGQTIIMVTHDSEIAQSCSRNIILADGKIIQNKIC